jgi:hypothetical protein
MSAVCPACGVAVLPGYVKCPKCHAGLPFVTGRIKRTTADPGGTAVARRGFPIVPVLVAVGVAAAVVIVGFVLRSGAKPTTAGPTALPGPVAATAAAVPEREPIAPLTVPAREPPRPATGVADRRGAAAELEATLRRQRLWGRSEITGDRIDVRSGSCADPAMRPAIDGAQAVLRGAGLTKLRCLEQSGAVVFERDL